MKGGFIGTKYAGTRKGDYGVVIVAVFQGGDEEGGVSLVRSQCTG